MVVANMELVISLIISLELVQIAYSSATHGYDIVMVRLVDISNKRQLDVAKLDDELNFQFRHWNKEINLNLKRNLHINGDAPVFTIDEDEGGFPVLIKTDVPLTTHQFQDQNNGGIFSVRCLETDVNCYPVIKGSFYNDGTTYGMEPLVGEKRHGRNKQKYMIYKKETGVENTDDSEEISKNYQKSFLKKYVHKLRSQSVFEKRDDVKKDYGIELVVVIDYSIYKRWYEESEEEDAEKRKQATQASIKEYFAHVINGVDLRFDSIVDDAFSIYIKLQGYIISTTAGTSIWNNGILQSNEGFNWYLVGPELLNNFRLAVEDMDFKGMATDHVMLFVGNDMYIFDQKGDVQTSVAGRAYTSGLCGSYRVSVAEDFGGFNSISTATHELAHNLGVRHDGQRDSEGNKLNDCKEDDQYIMSAATSLNKLNEDNQYNPWQFSQCSVDAIRSFLEDIESSSYFCLKNTAEHADLQTWNKHISNLPGQLYEAREQCQQTLGQSSDLCTSLIPNINDICLKMYCRTNDGRCRLSHAARGTTCGNKKWCIDGLCTYDEKAPTIDETCPYGDIKGAVFSSGETCEETKKYYAHECERDVVRQRCCKSCTRKSDNQASTTSSAGSSSVLTSTTTVASKSSSSSDTSASSTGSISVLTSTATVASKSSSASDTSASSTGSISVLTSTATVASTSSSSSDASASSTESSSVLTSTATVASSSTTVTTTSAAPSCQDLLKGCAWHIRKSAGHRKFICDQFPKTCCKSCSEVTCVDKYLSCHSFIKRHPSYCNNRAINEWCCASCSNQA